MEHLAQRFVLGFAIIAQGVLGGGPAVIQQPVAAIEHRFFASEAQTASGATWSAVAADTAVAVVVTPQAPQQNGLIRWTSDLVSVDASAGSNLANTVLTVLQETPEVSSSMLTSGGGTSGDLKMRLSLQVEIMPDAPMTVSIDLSSTIDAATYDQHLFRPQLGYFRPSISPSVSVFEELPTTFGPDRVLMSVVPVEAWSGAENMLQMLATSDDSTSQYSKYTEPQRWTFASNLGDVNAFRGSVAFGYKLSAPPLPGGYSPDLALNYSSAAADQLANTPNSPGVGWTIDVPRITQVYKLSWGPLDYCGPFLMDTCLWRRIDVPGSDPRDPWEGGVGSEEQFTLHFGGSQMALTRGPTTQYPKEYFPKEYSPLRIWRCSTTQPCNGVNVRPQEDSGPDIFTNSPTGRHEANVSGEYWQVWAPDGTLYVFGDDHRSEQMIGNTEYEGQASQRKLAAAWNLHLVYSPLRDNLDLASSHVTGIYEYAANPQTLDPPSGDPCYGYYACNLFRVEYEARLERIRYRSSQDSNESSFYEVGISYADTHYNEGRPVFQPTTVAVSNSGTGVLSYTFSYSADHNVQGITRHGPGGAELTDVTFGYEKLLDSIPGQIHLITVSNEYGGRSEYKYETVNGKPDTHRVISKTVSDGSSNPVVVTQYAYGTACFDSSGSDCDSGVNWPKYSGALAGHSAVTVTVLDAAVPTLALRKSSQSYYLDKRRQGRAYSQEEFDGSALVSRMSTEFTVFTNSVSPFTGLPSAAWFLAVSGITHTLVSGTSGVTTSERMTYDQYGDVIAHAEYGFTAVNGDERTTITEYTHNTANTVWIIGKPKRTLIFSGIVTPASAASQTPFGSTEFYYDGASTLEAPPTKGLLTHETAGVVEPERTSFSLGYDSHGNVSTVIDASGNATRLQYDPTGLFRIAVTNTLNQVERYGYYGINDTLCSDAGGSGPKGLIKCRIDPNNAATHYAYDGLGRLRKIAQPGDTLADPSEEWRYYDGVESSKTTTATGFSAGPYLTDHLVRGVSGGGWTSATLAVSDRTIYDGLGRVIQTQTRAGQGWEWAKCNDIPTKTLGTEIIQSTLYDALGRVSIQTMPYTQTQYEYCTTAGRVNTPYVAVPTTGTVSSGTGLTPTVPFVRTAYDALGRIVTVTDPAGGRIRHWYTADTSANYGYAPTGLWLHSYVDQNNHGPHEVSDGLGRIVKVREITGTGSTLWAYSETAYDYDAADRLTKVTDAVGNITTISYDALGRKTGMSDPDMGKWSYAYDALGQLTSQTDAKGQTMSFFYDALGRMTDKVARIAQPTIYEAEGTSSRHGIGCGSVITTVSSGTAWVGSCAGYLTYGPYSSPRQVGKGQTAIFRLAMASPATSDDSEIAKLEVSDFTANQQVIASRILKRSEFGGGSANYREFALDFDTTGRQAHQIEYRVLLMNNEVISHDRTTLLWQQTLATYTFDQGTNAIGHRSSMTDTSGFAGWIYDARGRVIENSKIVAPVVNTYTTRFGYDDANRVTTMTYPSGEVVTQTYDAAGQQNSLFAGGNAIVKSARYNALGAPTRVSFGNGLDRVNGYFGLDFSAGGTWGQLFAYGKLRNTCVITFALACDTEAPGALLNTVYWYDKAGNVTIVRDNILNSKMSASYDDLNRLVSAVTAAYTNTRAELAALSEVYAYDKIGNMTSKAGVTITNGTAKSGVISTLGFESYSVLSATNAGASYAYSPTGGAWTFESYAGVSYDNSAFTNGNPLAPEGHQVGFIQNQGRMTATFSGLTVGQTYRVGFMMAQRVNYSMPQTITVMVGSAPKGTFTSPTGVYEPKWSESFTASATTQPIAFWGAPANGQERTAFIDRVVMATAGPHAAVSMGDNNRYEYDPNGNMIVRREVSGTETFVYTQSWTIDNRLATVTKTNSAGAILAVTTYAYDGDGGRVKKTDPSGMALYLGEVELQIGDQPGATADFYDDVNGGAFIFNTYAGTELTATAGISFNWGTAPPHMGMSPTTWGIRFAGVFSIEYSGMYTFHIIADDGVALSIPGTVLVNSWITTTGAVERVSSPIFLERGKLYPFALSYFNAAGPGELRLEWDVVDCGPGGCVEYCDGGKGGGPCYLGYRRELVPPSVIHPLTRKSYYAFGGSMVAMREGPVLQPSPAPLSYIFGDHLGSSSLTTNASGQKVSEQRYKPYGEVRWASGAGMPTDKQFTSQTRLSESYVGTLYDYVARAYDPALGRFISADTLVPEAGNPQSLNRYTYVLGRPLVGTDPDGHCYPICTVLAGALIGGVVGAGAYALAMAVSGQEIRADHMLVAAAGGAVAGGLIGTGVMIAGAAAAAGASTSVATAAGGTWIAAGAGAASYGGGYLASLPAERLAFGPGHGDFAPTEYVATMTAGALDGAISSKVGPIGRFASSTLVGGVGSLAIDDALNGRISSPASYEASAVSGAISFGVSSVSKAVFRRPAMKAYDLANAHTYQVSSYRRLGISKARLAWSNAAIRLNQLDLFRQFLNGFFGSTAGDFSGDMLDGAVP